jgi:transposase-like protein
LPITVTLTCPHCQSEDLVKYGFAPDGRQRFRCKTCKKQHRENPRTNAYSPEEKEIIIKASQEPLSLRGVERTFGVNRATVSIWIKKKQINSPS